MDKNSAEYKTVINLYNDGRITATERDRLLAALGFDDERNGRTNARDDIFSDDDVYVNVSDGGDADENDEAEPEGFHISIDDERSLGEFLSGLGKKISSSAKYGFKTASDALDKASDKLRGAAKSISMQVAEELGTIKLDGVVEKRKGKSYDTPYDELEIRARYLHGGKNYNVSERADDAHKIKEYFKDRLDGELFGKLEDILDSKFTGKYLYMVGEDVLKITVAPFKSDDD